MTPYNDEAQSLGPASTSENRVAHLPDDELISELEGFLAGDRSLQQLECALEGRVSFEPPGQVGTIRIHAGLPTVPLRRDHILRILGQALDGSLSNSDVATWAAAVLVLDCFDLQYPGPNQDALSEAVWDLANDGAHAALNPTRIRELIDRVLDAAD